MTKHSILVVDDEQPLLDLLQLVLSGAGYHVVCAINARLGIQELARAQFNLVITDLLMPEKDGLEFIAEVRKKHPAMKIVAMSGGGRISRDQYLKIAKSFGAHALLEKGFGNAQLLETIDGLFPRSA